MEYVAWITIHVHLSSLSSQSIFFPFEYLSFGQMAQTKISFHVIPFSVFQRHAGTFPKKKAHLLSNHLQNTAAVSVSLTLSVEASPDDFFHLNREHSEEMLSNV